MRDSLRRSPRKRPQPAEPARPVLQLPIAEVFDDEARRASRHEGERDPERGVAVIDFYI